MRLLEKLYRAPIEELIMEGTLSQVARRLEIDQSTVYKWRIRLGLDNGA